MSHPLRGIPQAPGRAVTGVLLLLCLVLPWAAQAQTRAAQPVSKKAEAPLEPATIKGRIFDDETGETMPYTNVYLAGTNMGTMAFTDGFYIIRGLRPGTYTIKASYISYAVGQET